MQIPELTSTESEVLRTSQWSDDSTQQLDSSVEPGLLEIETSRLYSVSLALPHVNSLALLATAGNEPCFYWATPATSGGQLEYSSGNGLAAEILTPVLLDSPTQPIDSSFESIRSQLKQLFSGSVHAVIVSGGNLEEVTSEKHHPARPRFMGGFAFSPNFVPDNTWSVFHPAHFILPHFQVVATGDSCWLTINALAAPEDPADEIMNGLAAALYTYRDILARESAEMPPAADPVEPHNLADSTIRYPMTETHWDQMINSAISAIQSDQLEKVVLSRVGEVRLDESIDPEVVLFRLNEDYSDCYRFLFQPARGHSFVGATPELLIRLEDSQFSTMALAGSVRRGQTTAEDQELASQLLASSKDRLEHQLVVNEIAQRLGTVSDRFTCASEPDVLKLHNIQHLISRFNGRIEIDESDDLQLDVLSLVELLHPTPALGGVPRSEALKFMVEVEPVPRGWYAAPVGWIDANLEGAFAVGIRSAVCQHERAWLYAGAGIMADSQAAKEWAETELKFKPMLKAITQLG